MLRSARTLARGVAPGGFTPYTANAPQYDATRVPVGKEIVRDAARAAGTRRLLDVGCGTGALLDWLRAELPEAALSGLELNDGMLAQARARLAGTAVELHQGTLLDMPFADGAFDCVTIHQVLHHLPPADDFAAMRAFCREARRVLRPRGGVFVASLSSAAQYRDGVWHMALIPEAAGRVAARTPSPEQLCAALLDAGLRPERVEVPLQEVLQARGYLDGGTASVQSKAFRDGASTWELATEEELARALARAEALAADPEAERAFLEERERVRKTVGQSVFVVASSV